MNLEQIDTSTTAGKAEHYRERSNHRVYRVWGSGGYLPCYCWEDHDHPVGCEVSRDDSIRADLAGEVN